MFGLKDPKALLRGFSKFGACVVSLPCNRPSPADLPHHELSIKFLKYIKEEGHEVSSSLELSQKELVELKYKFASAISDGDKKTKQTELLQRSN